MSQDVANTKQFEHQAQKQQTGQIVEFRVELQRLPETFHCLVQSLEVLQGYAPVVVGVGMGTVDRQGAIETLDRRIRFIFFHQHGAAVQPGRGKVWLDGQ